jgi:cell division protein FtsI (penicillin-binding protein 3)
MGLLTRLETELPEVKTPTQPREWKKINSITISFGHGVSTTPLQTAVAAAALMNGGMLINPTFLTAHGRGGDGGRQASSSSEKTVEKMRYLYHAERKRRFRQERPRAGYRASMSAARRARPNKVVGGRYSKDVRTSTPSSPRSRSTTRQYVVLTFIDAPQPEMRGRGAHRRPQRRPDGGRDHPPLRQRRCSA